MSSDDTYGYRDGGYQDTGYHDAEYQADDTYGGRSSRRAAGREPTGKKRASAGTATAILIFAAILGFGGGAIAGNSGGDNGDPGTALEDTDNSTDGEENSDSEEDADDQPSEEAPGEGVTLTSPADGGEVASGEGGRFTLEGSTNPPAPGVALTVERSLDGGSTWADAGSSRLTTTTENDGTFETTVWSGREGQNMYRVVGEGPNGPLMSNEIVVTVVAGDGEE
jgi:hypothetical protein